MTLSRVMVLGAKLSVLVSILYMLAWIGATYLKGEVEMTTALLAGKWGVTALSIWIGYLLGYLIQNWRVNRRAKAEEDQALRDYEAFLQWEEPDVGTEHKVLRIHFLSDKEGK